MKVKNFDGLSFTVGPKDFTLDGLPNWTKSLDRNSLRWKCSRYYFTKIGPYRVPL